MSGNAGRGRDTSGGAGATTASATTKMLQNIKEIVGGNFPEDEIRAMLKECNMDPDEAIHRLLNQDTFHEVKSKREKKKETKDNGESRTRGVNNSLPRGSRSGTDFSGRVGSMQVISSDYAGTRCKPIQRRDNGPNIIAISSVLGSCPGDSGISRSSLPQSSSFVMENTGYLPSTPDTISSQYSEGSGNAWVGVPGQRTLADIVKMGRSLSKTTRIPFAQTESSPAHNISTSKEFQAGVDSSMVLPLELHHETPIPNVLELVHEPGSSASQEKSPVEWPSVTQIGHSLSESDNASAVLLDQSTPSNLLVGVDLGLNSGPDKERAMQESLDDDNLAEDSGRCVEASDGRAQLNTLLEESCGDVSVDIPSTMSSLQQLNFHEDTSVTQADDNPAVIFPNDLQMTNSECSHLSFGSFRTGISATFSESLAPNIPSCNLEVPPETTDDNAVEHSDPRDPEYCSSEQLRPLQNENVDPAPSSNSETYEIPSSHPDDIRVDPSDVTEHAYTNSSPSDFLRSAVQPAQEFELPYSSLLAPQSMTTKYSSSSVTVPSIAMLEGLNPGVFSIPQPTQHNLPTTVPMGPTVPQPLSVQSYPQPTPLGHFANLIGYQFLPQSYAYMPSAAFQQAYSSDGAYNQAPTAASAGIKYTLPPYKSNVAIPQASVISSSLGGFGSSTNILGNPALNPLTSSANTSVGYDDMSSSQYKDANHFVRAQQSESPTIWLNEGGSRTMSSLAARTYYGLQGQSQLGGGIRQSRQLSPYGAVGYQNLHQSQAGVSHEHQQYGGGSLSAARVPASQMASQIWQHNY